MHRYGPIPEILHSEETGEPFVSSNDCGEHLLLKENGYLIQKVISKGETIMEMAICEPCHKKLHEEYSAETKERMWNFYLDNGSIHKRLERFEDTPAESIDPWVDQCLTCSATKTSCEEYAIAVHCLGGELIFGETPFMVCQKCMDQISSLLSEESLGTYDRWLEKCLPMAPSQPPEGSPKRVLI
ncbi:MAG: hypothetical protein ACSHX7_11025 [Luteolibacter sp.]